MIDAEVGHDANEDQAEDQAELEALEEAERSQGADFIDDSIMESGDMPNYNSTDIFGSDSESQAELEQLASAQRADQADGRPALDVSEAAAIRQAATGPQASTNSAEEAALDNAFGNSGAGGFVAPVPGFVQQAQAQAGQPELGIYPNWDPSDERITEIRCRQGTRGILVGDPVNPISYFSGYISAIGESSDVSPTIMLGLERFACMGKKGKRASGANGFCGIVRAWKDNATPARTDNIFSTCANDDAREGTYHVCPERVLGHK